MDFCRIRCSRSSRDNVAGADTAERFMTSVAGPESCIPRSRPRRMSPSVTMPTRRPEPSSTSATCMLPLSIAAIASLTVASVPTMALRQDFMCSGPYSRALPAQASRENSGISRLPTGASIPAGGRPKPRFQQRNSSLGLRQSRLQVAPKPLTAQRIRNRGGAERAVRLNRCPARQPQEGIAGFDQDTTAVPADHFAGRAGIGPCAIDLLGGKDRIGRILPEWCGRRVREAPARERIARC